MLTWAIIHQSQVVFLSGAGGSRDPDALIFAFPPAFWLELATAGVSPISRPPSRKLFYIDRLTANQGPLNAEIRRKDKMRLACCPIIRERAL